MKTKEEIFSSMKQEMPWGPIGEKQIKPYLFEAMEIYAKQEAIAFANWLQYQEIDDRSTEKLYRDFKEQIV